MKIMPTTWVALAAALLLFPMHIRAQAVPYVSEAPPVEQTLVREGDFALSLAQILGVGRAESETEAERDLTALGIAPQYGWISDYPVTPGVIDELYEAVGFAADRGDLALHRQEALRRFDGLLVQLDLPIRLQGERMYAEDRPPPNYGRYSDRTVIHNYYHQEGPPVVTYYTPPPAYVTLYSWVPYPFWWGHFHFTGYYVLRDFHLPRRVFIVQRGEKRSAVKKVSNRFYDRDQQRITRVDSARRFREAPRGRSLHGSRSISGTPSEIRHREGRKDPTSVVRRDVQRAPSSEISRQRSRAAESRGLRERSRQTAPQGTNSPRLRENRTRSSAERNQAVQRNRAEWRERSRQTAPQGTSSPRLRENRTRSSLERNQAVQRNRSEWRSERINRSSGNRTERIQTRGRVNFNQSSSGAERSLRSPGRNAGESRSFSSGRARGGSGNRSFSRGGGSSRSNHSSGPGRSGGRSGRGG